MGRFAEDTFPLLMILCEVTLVGLGGSRGQQVPQPVSRLCLSS